MDLLQFRQALGQTLETYQRCGLPRTFRTPTESIPTEWLAAIDGLAAAQEGHGDRSEGDSPGAQPPAANSPGTEQREGSPGHKPAAFAASQPTGLASEDRESSSHWELPVLNMDERRQRFDELDQDVRQCRECTEIVGYRRQTVFGSGNLQPRVCFMGEAPGADEDRLGQPFVGRAGQLLTKIIEAMKFSRDDVYILNALKCRPPQNRTPVPDEIEHCHRFVQSQLEVLQPEYIVCLGAVAVRSILKSTDSIGRLRGRFHAYRGARVVVTYHPSYLLRNESAKRLVWDDMKMLLRELGMLS